MTLPGPPYTVVDIGDPKPDNYGNTGSFIRIAEFDDRVRLSMKQGFPKAGDVIADRTLQELPTKDGTSTFFKLVKPQSQNGSQGRSQGVGGDGPDEAYWAGQNAAKGRAHAQEMAIRAHAAGWKTSANQTGPDVFALTPLIDWFQKDAEQARDRAVEEASGQAAARPDSSAAASPVDGVMEARTPPEQPTGLVTSSDTSPTERQTEVLLKMARERGLDGPAMKRYLKAYCGVEQFSQLPKQGCIDRWAEALKRPDPVSDIPVGGWPPEARQPSDPDSSLPF